MAALVDLDGMPYRSARSSSLVAVISVISVISAVFALGLVGCRSVPLHPDPVTLGDSPACPAVFEAEVAELEWRKNVVTAGRIGGVVLAASGPAAAVGGIVLDDQPATPPVEAFVLGAGLSGAGVIAVVVSGMMADEAELHAQRARDAYAKPCG